MIMNCPASEVSMVGHVFDASNGAETPFHHRWGGDVFTLTASHIERITQGQTLAPLQLSKESWVTAGDFSCSEISFPSFSEQKHIAQILGTLDKKIKLNRRMNATRPTS